MFERLPHLKYLPSLTSFWDDYNPFITFKYCRKGLFPKLLLLTAFVGIFFFINSRNYRGLARLKDGGIVLVAGRPQ